MVVTPKSSRMLAARGEKSDLDPTSSLKDGVDIKCKMKMDTPHAVSALSNEQRDEQRGQEADQMTKDHRIPMNCLK